MKAFLVNSFTDRLGGGNPAGVVFHDGTISAEAMQVCAVELGKSESSFVQAIGEPGKYRIRWFSPRQEMSLCGHATLAASKVLFDETGLERLEFQYMDGWLVVRRLSDGWMEMDFPLDPFGEIECLDAYRGFFGDVDVLACLQGAKTGKVALVLADGTDLSAIRPDFRAMASFAGPCTRGIGITTRSQHFDFESRYFNPWVGVDEDSVTGSFHTVVAGYWARRLGKTKLRACQVSSRRGELGLEVAGDLVRLSGQARVVLRGDLL